MKRITFAKRIFRGGFREDYPGYLFEHSAHPGREFVIARGSWAVRGTEGKEWRHSKEWILYDRASGVALHKEIGGQAATMRACEDRARNALFTVSPDGLQEKIDTWLLKQATRALNQK